MIRPMQQVTLGVTQGGQHGLFTNHVLVLPLSFKEYYNLVTMDHELARKLVRNHWEFDLVWSKGAWWNFKPENNDVAELSA